jgi:hypothetical protein
MRNIARLSTLLISSLLVAEIAAAASHRDIAAAVNDDQKLIYAGLEPEKAMVRRQCSAAVIETDDPVESFNCVYVQTEKDVNLLSLEDGYLMSELQMKVNVMDGVALQRMGRFVQVQVFSGRKTAAFYIHGDNWLDADQTEAVYQWLLAQGVPQRSPRGWIGR